MVLAIMSGLLMLSLAVPLDVRFRFEGIAAFNGRFVIRWLFGLVRFSIGVPSPARWRRGESGSRPDASGRRTNREKRGGRTRVVAALQQSDFRRRVYRLARDLIRAAQPTELGLRLRLGLGDPADTGRLWAFVGPLSAAARNLDYADVRIEPAFGDPAFEFETHGRLRLIPLQFLALIVAFALSPSSIRVWRTMRVGHA